MSAAVDHGFLPSGRYIFNHDIMNCPAGGIAGNHLYSGRALGLSQPWDIIQLPSNLESDWPTILGHYERIGLSHTEHVIWDLSLDHLGAHIGYQPSVFYFGREECRCWGDSHWLETVEYINSKNNFTTLARELGMDIPDTWCFDSVGHIEPDLLEETVFPCYLKADVSVAGIGVYRCADRLELADAMGKIDDGMPVQIQKEVRTESILNLQYRVIDDELVRLAASEQILDGFVHQGNRAPATHEPWGAVDPMAHWLKDHGIKGIFAFDIAVVQTDQGLKFPAIECNPRYNWATYPTLIARKLNIPEWRAVSLPTRYKKLSAIDLEDIEFDAATGEGAIIVNWGTVSTGRITILMAGSQPYQEALAVELEARL